MAKNHHKKSDFCYSRPDYREARWERAVKAYTINQESKYLLVQGVPSVGVRDELIQMFALYGDVEEYRLLDEYPGEKFTDVYWIKFIKIQAARFAKRKLDNRSFYGSSLHVCYAPEYESVDDTRKKLHERRIAVARKIKELSDANHFEVEPEVAQKANEPIGTNKIASTTPSVPAHATSQHAPPNYLHLNPLPVSGFNPNPNDQIRYYPMLPPPPMDHSVASLHPPHPFHLQPPPPPPPPPSPMQSHPSQRYPRVPSSHATLPRHLQDSAVEIPLVYPTTSKSSVQVRNLPDKKPSKIVWNKPSTQSPSEKQLPPLVSTPLVDRSKETFATPQGPCDPYYRKRKKEQSLTGSDDMDKLVDRVRKKLSKLSDS